MIPVIHETLEALPMVNTNGDPRKTFMLPTTSSSFEMNFPIPENFY